MERWCASCADPEGGTGGHDPLPEKSKKYSGLSNNVPNPLKTHKAANLAFNIGQSSARNRNVIFAGVPMKARFYCY